jgi:hypothetical protein
MAENIQLFNDDSDVSKIDSCFAAAFNYIETEKQKFFDGAYDNKSLGQIIFDLNLMPLVVAIEEQTFLNTFSKVLESFREVGNFENYLIVLGAIFGPESTIEFERTDPAFLTINITSVLVTEHILIGSDGTFIIGDEGSQLVGDIPIAGIDSRSLLQILKSCTPAGIYVEFDITEG